MTYLSDYEPDVLLECGQINVGNTSGSESGVELW